MRPFAASGWARVSLAGALVLTLSTGAAADERDPEGGFPCVGHWTGVGHNSGLAQGWTIDMVVTPPDAAGRCGTIEYTTPSCGGTMESCRAEGGRVEVRERYTHSSGCAPPATLRFSCDGDSMRWAWHGWEVARTTLRRVDSAPQGSGAGPPGGSDRPAPALPPGPEDVPDELPNDQRSNGLSPPVAPDVMPSSGCRCGVSGPISGSPASWFALLGLAVVSAAIRRRLA